MSFKSAPDFETKNSYTITITATDNVGNTSAQNITISITDIDEIAPLFTSSATPSVKENNTEVVTVTTDEPVTLSLGGTDASSFQFFGDTLFFIGSPDFETDPHSYTIDVTATDTAGNTSTQNITVTLVNTNDNAPVLGSIDNTYYIPEGTTQIVTVPVSDVDGDTITFDFQDTNTSIFNCNTVTGEVSLVTPLDYEVVGSTSYTVKVVASDGLHLSSYRFFYVITTDVQGAPVITSPSSITIAENSTDLFTVTAHDDENDVMTYAIGSGGDSALFSIDSSSGVLTLNTPKDFEDGTSNTLTVNLIVSDTTGLETPQTVTVNISDVNEAPQLTLSSTSLSLAEEQVTPTILTATANDVDLNSSLTFTIGGDDAAHFSIDAQTGLLSMNITPDRENPQDLNGDNIYTLNLTVSDGLLDDSVAITVTINDINDNLPTFDASQAISIAENIQSYGVIPASDADSTSTVVYSLEGGDDVSKFTINSATGELRFIASPDYENPTDSDLNNIYNVQIGISDGTLVTANFTVEVTDEITPQLSSMDDTAAYTGTTAGDGVWSAIANNGGVTIYKYVNGSWQIHTTLAVGGAGIDLKNGTLVTSKSNALNNGTFNVHQYDPATDQWTEVFSDVIAPTTSSSGSTCEQYSTLAFNGTDMVAVGIAQDDGAKGKVLIYKNVAGTWGLQETLLEPTPTTYNFFGCGVAVEGSKVIVGTPNAENGGSSNVGAVYIYNDNGTALSLEHTIYGNNFASAFGARVAIQNSNLLVSEPNHPNGTGLVHFLTYNSAIDYTNTDIAPADTTSRFGNQLVWKGDYIAVNAEGDTENEGAYYLYKQNGTSFTEMTKLVSPVAITNYYGLEYKASFVDQYFIFGTYAKAYAYNYIASDELLPNIKTSYLVKEGTLFLDTAADDLQDGHSRSTLSVSITGGDDASLFTLNAQHQLQFKAISDYENPTDLDANNIYNIIITADDGTYPRTENVTIEVTDAPNAHVTTQLIYEPALSDFDSAPDEIDVSGNYMIVGMSNTDDSGTSSGSAYIYSFDGSNWSKMQKLTASDAQQGDLFGGSVAIYGDYAIVGARYETNLAYRSGAAYLFHYDGTAWIQIDKLLPSGIVNASDNFGQSVDIDANRIVISASADDEGGTSTGALYVFTYNTLAATLSEKLINTTASGFSIGSSVALSGNTIVSAGYGLPDDTTDNGMMLFIDTNNDGIYESNQSIPAPSGSTYFGRDLSFDGSRIAVADYQQNSVHIYSNGVDGWLKTATITNIPSFFGSSVAINGTTLLVGASGDDSVDFINTGAVYIYTKGSTWTQTEKVTGFQLNINEGFGESVCFGTGTSTFLVGAEGVEIDGRTNGGVFSFSAE